MAVQIRWQDGMHQWLKGALLSGHKPYLDSHGFMRYYDGFAIIHDGRTAEFGTDCSVISMTDDSRVSDWSRRKGTPE